MTLRAEPRVPTCVEALSLRVMLLTRSLRPGGAERQAVTLANGLAARGHNVTVVEFYHGGELAEHLSPTVRRACLQKRRRWDIVLPIIRLAMAIRRFRPDFVCGYLVEPNIATLVAKAVRPSTSVVWGVRASAVNMADYDLFTQGTFAVARWLSRFADVILLNSSAGWHHHAGLGYPRQKMVVVANGIDTDHFRPDPEEGARVRGEWGVSSIAPLVGIVGRLDPIKDHRTFIQAAAILAASDPVIRFVVVGDGDGAYSRDLRSFAQSALGDRLVWSGGRKDMRAAYSALDIHCSSSVTEGFPNVIAEAMACGVPCVVTNVGDSAAIVGRTGIVVPPSSPVALASGIRQALQWLHVDRTAVCNATRARITDEYSMARLVDRTVEALVRSL